MKTYLLPHGPSNGAAALADALGIKRIKRENSRFTPDFSKLVINWGNSADGRLPPFMAAHANWLNSPQAVGNATDKRTCWSLLANNGVPTVQWCCDIENAIFWLQELKEDVLIRTQLKSSGGAGIHVLKSEECCKIGRRDLYTKIIELVKDNGGGNWAACLYFKAKEEYRVHVLRDKILDVQQKRRNTDVPREEVNYAVRSHANGFVFCRENVDPPEAMLKVCVDAVAALGLDFGAVDVRYNTNDKTCCVLEVNTAPGLEGSTIEKYSGAFTELLSGLTV